MLNGCVTSPSSTVSMMSPSSANSSPQASSSFSQDRSPVSSPSRTNFPTVPLIKPSAIKDPAVHFPPSTLPSMCFPLHAIYAQNPYSGIVGSNLSTFFSPHAIARQMSFLGNSFSQNMSGNGNYVNYLRMDCRNYGLGIPNCFITFRQTNSCRRIFALPTSIFATFQFTSICKCQLSDCKTGLSLPIQLSTYCFRCKPSSQYSK